jgi:hypothetical protein
VAELLTGGGSRSNSGHYRQRGRGWRPREASWWSGEATAGLGRGGGATGRRVRGGASGRRFRVWGGGYEVGDKGAEGAGWFKERSQGSRGGALGERPAKIAAGVARSVEGGGRRGRQVGSSGQRERERMLLGCGERRSELVGERKRERQEWAERGGRKRAERGGRKRGTSCGLGCFSVSFSFSFSNQLKSI